MAPRSLKIACIVSILLNIFLLAGVVGGAVWLRAKHPMIGAGSIRIAGAELPVAERRAFRTALREKRRELRPVALAGKQARIDAAGLLRAPTLDQPALAEALGRVRTADITMREQLETRAIAFAATLPPEERGRLAEGLLRRPDMTRQPAVNPPAAK